MLKKIFLIAILFFYWNNSFSKSHIIIQKHGVMPVASTVLAVPYGSANVTQLPAGSLYLTKLLIEQSKLSSILDKLGTSLNMNIGHNFTSLEFTTLSHLNYEAVNKILTFLKQWKPKDTEISRVKQQLIAYIKQSESDPENAIRRVSAKHIFNNHPYSQTIMGNIETVPNISSQDIMKVLSMLISQENLYIMISGDTTKTNLQELQKIYQQLPDKSGFKPSKIEKPTYLNSDLFVKDPKLSQSFIQVVITSNNDTFENFPYMLLAEQMIGRGFSSRLFLELRQKRGLTYSPAAYYSLLKYSGNLNIIFSTKKSSREEALKVLNNTVLEKIKESGFTQQELDIAKKIIINRISKEQEYSSHYNSNILKRIIYNFPKNTDNLLIKDIKLMTIKKFNLFIQSYLKNNSIIHITLG